MINLFSVVSILVSTLFLPASNVKSDLDLKLYYFPVESMKGVQVYHYINESASNAHVYMVLERRNKNGATYLNRETYLIDTEIGNLQRAELAEEEIALYGSYLRGYTNYTMASEEGQLSSVATIGSNTVLTWKMDLDERVEWNVEYTDPVNKGYVTKVRRIRTFTKDKVKVQYDGKKLSAVEFEEKFEIKYGSVELGDWKTTSDIQISTYAFGIGMFSFTRKFDNNQETFSLSEILSFKEWTALKEKLSGK